MCRVVLPPIIRSVYNCIYSIWYLSHRYCYLTLSWKSWNRFECTVGGVRHVFQRNLNFLGRFWKNTRTKFIENPSSGRQVVQFGRTDGHTDKARRNNDNSSFSQFSECAWKVCVLLPQRLFPYTALTDWFLLTATTCVYCAVRTGSLYIIYVLPTQRIYVFCVDLRTNSDYFPMQH
jgi:hypothetical protein